MSLLEQTILRESRKFRELLPSLLHLYAGKWIVFRCGQVVSVHTMEIDAYTMGVKLFGVDGGFVIAQVVKVEPIRM